MCTSTASRSLAVREEITTVAPSLANRSAIARPIPRPPPVITATRPSSCPTESSAQSESGVAQRRPRVEVLDRGFRSREQRLREHATRLADRRERHDLRAGRHSERGLDPVREPGFVEGDLDAAHGVPDVEIVAEQVTFVRAPVVDRQREREEIADVAQWRARLDDAPVEEAHAIPVEEQVADVRVAVDDGLRP